MGGKIQIFCQGDRMALLYHQCKWIMMILKMQTDIREWENVIKILLLECSDDVITIWIFYRLFGWVPRTDWVLYMCPLEFQESKIF